MRKTGTCYNNGNGNVKNSFQIKSREGERICAKKTDEDQNANEQEKRSGKVNQKLVEWLGKINGCLFYSKKVEKVLSDELKKLLMHMNILSGDKCLIIGLGNANSTPDSLGPKVSENIIVTKHLFDLEDVSVLDGYRNVSSA